ncbi:DNA polymerase III subunit delta' [Natronospora cellulosivora (SeqCode)]
MAFSRVLGQEHAIALLEDQLRGGRIHHAYLFTGKEGVGKKTLASEFVKAIYCLHESGDACEQCLTCRKIEHKNHPDIKYISIDEGESIKIEQIRDLQKDIAYKPYDSSWKVYIIENADKMTGQAANSLLKTLEEPPEYGIIILLAEDIDSLLPTVISRCQQIKVKNLASDLIERKIMDNLGDADRAHLLANIADGSLGQALSLIEDDDFFNKRQVILETLQELSSLDAVKLFDKANKWLSFLKENDKFPLFDLILSWYRDIILYNQGYNKAIVNVDYLEEINKESRFYSTDKLISTIEMINTINGYISKNVRKDLALEVLLLKLRAKKVE